MKYLIVILMLLFSFSCKKREEKRMVDFTVSSPVRFSKYVIQYPIFEDKITNVSPTYTVSSNGSYVYKGSFEARVNDYMSLYFFGGRTRNATLTIQGEKVPLSTTTDPDVIVFGHIVK